MKTKLTTMFLALTLTLTVTLAPKPASAAVVIGNTGAALFLVAVGVISNVADAIGNIRRELDPIKYEDTQKLIDAMQDEMGDDYYTIVNQLQNHEHPLRLKWIKAKGPKSAKVYETYVMMWIAAY